MREEIRPFLAYRRDGDQFECALWSLSDGPQALALFLTQDTAQAYLQAAQLSTDWQVFCPGPADLLQILRECTENGIEFAVLDPTEEQAKRIFDLRQVVQTMDAS